MSGYKPFRGMREAVGEQQVKGQEDTQCQLRKVHFEACKGDQIDKEASIYSLDSVSADINYCLRCFGGMFVSYIGWLLRVDYEILG